MKLWLSNEEPVTTDKDIRWVKNSWDALKEINDYNFQIAEDVRCPFDTYSILDALKFPYLECICLDCIPESVKFLERLLEMKYNKYYKFYIMHNGHESDSSKKYFYEKVKEIITDHSDALYWVLKE